MVNALVQLCLRRRAVVWLVFVFVAIYGWMSWKSLPVEAYPDIADVTSQVITQVPGLAAEEVELQITVPLERALLGTPGLHVLRSRSTFGLSMITVVFQDGVEGYWSRQRLQERINDVDLPYGAKPGLDPYTSPIGEIYRYTLESSSRDLRELSELQRWVVIPHLKKVHGVVDVTNFGGVTTQFLLELDPTKLQEYNLSIRDVVDAVEASSVNAGGGVMSRGEQAYVIRGVGLIRSLEDLGSVVVAAREGVPVYLSDLGRLTYGFMERRGVMGKDRQSDVVSGIVLMLKDFNPSVALEGVHKAVEELNHGLLPSDVKVVPYLDRTTLIEATSKTVGKTLLEGLVLVTLVLILFLGSPRAALIVAITIPLALLIAFIFMRHLHIPANLLSLGAIDFGILVDGAVVVVENLLRRREADEQCTLTLQDAVAATLEVARPIFFGMLVIIAAYLPLFAFERIEYKLFAPMAFAVGAALIGALIVALTLVPGLAYLAFRKPKRLFHNPVLRALDHLYAKILAKVVQNTRMVMVLAGAAILSAAGLAAQLGRDFLPYIDEGSLWLQVSLPPGITLDKARDMADELRLAVLEFPEVSYITTQTGRNDDGTDPWTPSHIEASVGLHPYSTWASGLTKQELIQRMEKRLSHMPGFVVGFMQPMIDGVQDKLSGAHSDLVVKIFGDDFGEMRRVAERVRAILQAVPGAADVAIDQEPPLPNLRIEIDRVAAARYGVNAADVAELIAKGIGGEPIGQVFIGERFYDVVTRFPSHVRDDPMAMAALQLTTPSGAKIPLAEVARIQTLSGESTITREMGARHLTVRLNNRGKDLASFLREAQARLDRELSYDGSCIHLVWGGQFENMGRAQSRLAVIMPLALGIMYILLFAQFGNFRQPALILLVVPLAAIGGMLALEWRSMTLNVSSAVGFIALFGVAVLNGVLMLAQINRLRAEEGVGLLAAVLEGARSRLRPVLMTASVAALGLTPAMLATGLGSDVQRPLATVVVGGLVSATLLTLILLPALYYFIERHLEAKGEAASPDTIKEAKA